MSVNRQIVLKARPLGAPAPSDFALVETPIPQPKAGEVLCRTIYLSLDPYMRGRIGGGRSYARPVEIGQVIVGGTVSEVVESQDDSIQPGDFVVGHNGWQEYALAKAAALRRLDPAVAPIATALSVLGMPGLTAYVGLLDIGRPQPGETAVVAAASGAVGSVVGQLAKIKGCRVVGVAGTREKGDWVVRELGFDECVIHRAVDFPDALSKACPSGIDVYFENVGGKVLQAVLPLLNVRARIPLCGLISQYNATEPVAAPDLRALLINRALIQGFIVSDHLDRMPDFLRDCTGWLRAGRLKYRHDIVDGLAQAPEALIGLLAGRNFGKMLVCVSADPTGGKERP